MDFKYETRVLTVGGILQLGEGEMLTGSTLEVDREHHGQFMIVAHVLVPVLVPQPEREKGN